LEKQLSRPANTEDIAKALKISPKKAAIIQDALTAVNTLHQQAAAGGEQVDLSEVLIDERSAETDEKIFDEAEIQIAKELLGQLEPREARILTLRYGLDAETETMTLKEVGEAIGLTRERVRQVERSALAKLEEYIQRELHTNDAKL